ncbi:hypothetical protein ACTXT7_001396 [Hymenolepis weldensis]
MCICGALVTVPVYRGGGLGFDSHRRTSSERNGQPYWLSLANVKGGRTPISGQNGSMMPLSTQDGLFL